MSNKFEWLPTWSAPVMAPVEIYEAVLWHKTERLANIKNWGVFNPGWGKTSGTAVIGDRQKPVPDSINVTWLSMAENTFYTLRTALPQAAMEQLFSKGFVSIYGGQPATYTELIMGLAPGGFVALWLAGEKEQVEIATFKAQPVTIPLEQVAEADLYMFAAGYARANMENVKAEQRAQLTTTNFLGDYWPMLHQKQPWQPAFELPEGVAVDDVTIGCVNGGQEAHLGAELKSIDIQARALPRAIVLRWHEAGGNYFGAEITLDDTEIREAFKSITPTAAGGASMVLGITNNKISITLKSSTHQYPLAKSIINVYGISK